MAKWIKACAHDDVAREDVLRLDRAGLTFATYRIIPPMACAPKKK